MELFSDAGRVITANSVGYGTVLGLREPMRQPDHNRQSEQTKLLYRRGAAVEDRLVIVAPRKGVGRPTFGHVTEDPGLSRFLVEAAQRLRGEVYVSDGAVPRHHLTSDGRYCTPEDEQSWHLMFLDGRGGVSACVWFLHHQNDIAFGDLRVRSSPLARAEEWRHTLWAAVESELADAKAHSLGFAEIGGWAVSQKSRRTVEGLVLALGAFSLGQLLGGAMGMTTATVRHASCSILRRLGGSLLEFGGQVIPPYFDATYGCMMELLRFDSRSPSPKYAALVDRLCETFLHLPVIVRSPTFEPGLLNVSGAELAA